MDIKDYVVESGTYVTKAVYLMSQNEHKGLIICKNNKVIGVFTRRDMVKCAHVFGMEAIPIDDFMNSNFFYFENSLNGELGKNLLYTLVPVVNKEMELIDIYFPKRRTRIKNYHYPVVIMAGGLGTRLYPYTKILPKPLVPINGTPMVEMIINKFLSFGTKEFSLIINYKKEMIKAYFDNLDKNYTITYGEEETQLGTGGGLYYVKDKIKSTFFMTNCDILLMENYDEIYKFHKDAKNLVTVIVSIKSINVPYGIVKVGEDKAITGFTEKPTYGLLTNTGIYVVEKEIFNFIKKDERIDFPVLLEQLIELGHKIGVYPVTEDKWIDMGQVDEYKHACEVLK